MEKDNHTLKDAKQKAEEVYNAVLDNLSADEILEKVQTLQYELNRVDLPVWDYEDGVALFGYPQQDEHGFIYSKDSLYRHNVYSAKPDTAYSQKRNDKGHYWSTSEFK